MSPLPDLLHAHAAALTQLELGRRGSPLLALPPERRPQVAAVAVRVAAELADGLLEHARASPAVASALASIYGDGTAAPPPLVGSVLEAAD
jgi:nicotinamide mononucleotide (NMN) deamidase PncC